MKSHVSAPIPNAASVMALAAICVMLPLFSAQSQTGSTVPVTVDNFIRAESDLYMSVVALKEAGFGQVEIPGAAAGAVMMSLMALGDIQARPLRRLLSGYSGHRGMSAFQFDPV